MPLTTRLSIPTPTLPDPANVPADMLALAVVLDDAAVWDEGAYASRPLTGACPKGTLYRQTDSGGGAAAGSVSLNTASGWQPLSLTADQLAAIAGSAGTPSAANPFLTEDDTGVMHTDKTRTVTAQHTYQASPAPLSTTYGSGGGFVIPNTHRPVLYVTATGVTLTLPEASLDGGGPCIIVNASTGDLIVQRAGSDNIDASGTTSITIPARTTVVLQPFAGTTYWRTIGVGGEGNLDTNRAQSITGVKTFTQRPKHAVNVITATAAIAATAGRLNTFAGAASQTVTMPAAAVGDELEILNIDTADTLAVTRAGSDTFTPAGPGATVTTMSIPAGGRVKFACVVAGTWHIIPMNTPLLPAATTSISGAVPNPYDGMEVRYQNAAMLTDGVLWTFRYNAAGGTYKWERIAGELWRKPSGTLTETGTTYNAPNTGTPPTIAIPIAGEYRVELEAIIVNASVATSYLSPSGAGITAGDNWLIHSSTLTDATSGGLRKGLSNVPLTVNNMTVQARVSTGTGTYYLVELSAAPARVAA